MCSSDLQIPGEGEGVAAAIFSQAEAAGYRQQLRLRDGFNGHNILLFTDFQLLRLYALLPWDIAQNAINYIGPYL